MTPGGTSSRHSGSPARLGVPGWEIADLGHLGIAGPCSGQSLLHGLEFSEEAVRIADTHGGSDDPALLTALAAGAMALLWLWPSR